MIFFIKIKKIYYIFVFLGNDLKRQIKIKREGWNTNKILQTYGNYLSSLIVG